MFNKVLLFSQLLFLIYINCPAQDLLPELTDSLKVNFNHKAGFYDHTFSLEIYAPEPDYFIVYTIDGSNPQFSATAINSKNPTTILIDPNQTGGRPKTPCFIVRASVGKTGFLPSKPLTQTYIFVEEVIKQGKPGGGWPSSNINSQIIDLEMDTDITQSSKYANQLAGSLTDIPSLSIVTDIENLFDQKTGIYVNALQHGEDWERFCSFELIFPSGEEGFSINAGLRIRGGWSRHGDYPKHGFRLFFREEYGAAKLHYPLFGNEGVDEFDKMDIRCEQNYAWSNGFDNNTCVREVFSRDTQRDMGQPYTRSMYYHLYLNGMYWGLFQTQERSEACYAADYFGGSKEDYDVIKVNVDGYVIEATDGTIDPWKRLLDVCNKGFVSNENYFALEGKNSKGNPQPGGEVFVDIDNLIDFMLTIFYTGNFDSPISAFMSNSKANNFYSIYKHDDKTKGFIFFIHDAEHAMMVDPHSPGIGLYEDRVNLELNKPGITNFTPQWLHIKLSENEEYRQRFIDRVYQHFFNDGVFTEEKAQERFEKRVAEIDKAIIAESARWGDAKSGIPYTRDDHWLPEIEDIYDRFFPYRTDIVLDQLSEAGLHSSIAVPTFQVNNENITSNHCNFNESIEVKITSTTNNGELYITRDGHDPRDIGGEVYSNAQKINSGFSMVQRRSTILKSRIKRDNNWSPLHILHLLQNSTDFSELKITELNYHPTDSIIGQDTILGESFEFVELKNIGDNSINLSELKFSTAIEYTFPENEILAPKSFYVIASKPKWFYEKYGMVPSGNYKKNLSNSGERVIMADSKGNEIFNFDYTEFQSWYPSTDGQGYTLASANRNPWGWEPTAAGYWKVSAVLNGSPFADDRGITDAVREFKLAESKTRIFPNPASRFLTIDISNFEKEYKIEIVSINGKRVFETTTREDVVIDLSSLPIGNGLLLVKINEGNNFKLHKILYQH